MKIYQLDQKGIKKAIRKMNQTTYGKIVLLLAYSLPLIFLLLLILTMVAIMYCRQYAFYFSMTLSVTAFLCLFTFIKGSKYYYHELKEFIEKSKI